jgi:hypothetical protein
MSEIQRTKYLINSSAHTKPELKKMRRIIWLIARKIIKQNKIAKIVFSIEILHFFIRSNILLKMVFLVLPELFYKNLNFIE